MMLNTVAKKIFIRYVIKFLLVFAVLYYGSFAVIGLSAPGSHYSPIVAKYLDHVALIKWSLMWGVHMLLSFFGVDTVYFNDFTLRIPGGRGVFIYYGCAGIGVMSFWVAFVAAGFSHWKNKIKWMLIGLFIIWVINVIRIALFLLSLNGQWEMPLGLNHHTWFTIWAYIAIFILIIIHEKKNPLLPA